METYDTMIKIWEGLRSKADKDNDGQVSVMNFYILYIKGSDIYGCHFIFKMCNLLLSCLVSN